MTAYPSPFSYSTPSGGTVGGGGLTGRLTGNAFSLSGDVRAFADERTAVVDEFVSNLQNAVLTLVAPTIVPEFPTGGAAPAVDIPSPPTFAEPVWTAPGLPTALTAVLDVGDLDVEPFDIDPPALTYGSPPAAFDEAVPDAPGINLIFDDPTLTVSLPAPPALLSLSIVPFSGLNLPTFDADEPTLVAVEPSIREYTAGSQYTSDLLTTLKDKLAADITGGTGLSQEAENALWDRGREREYRAQFDALRQLDQMESLGYAFPPGVYLDARLKVSTETDYAIRGHSREVMIKSAELALDNVKHALTTATALEGQLIDYTNATEQRLFESSRYATEAQVAIYNAKVQAYAQMVDAYRAKVAVYEAQVRAEVSRVDAYRAQISAEEAKATINRALVDQYRVEVDAALSNIRIYEAEIAGIQAKAEIEKTKIMIFGEQVRGYTAQVNAYTAGVEGFRATIQADVSRQQAYQSQVEAFRARVDANARQVESRVAAYRGQIEAKNAEYDGYRAAVQGETARVESIARIGSVRADAYRSEVAAAGAYNDVLVRQWQATLDQNQRTAEIGINAAKANAELYITSRSLALDAVKTGATVAAQLGAASINALNFSASVSSSEGYNESRSESRSESNSNSNSNSNSTSVSYNYNASI